MNLRICSVIGVYVKIFSFLIFLRKQLCPVCYAPQKMGDVMLTFGYIVYYT